MIDYIKNRRSSFGASDIICVKHMLPHDPIDKVDEDLNR